MNDKQPHVLLLFDYKTTPSIFRKYDRSKGVVIHLCQPLLRCSSPQRFQWHSSHPHLFCKLIQGYQQPGRLIRQSFGGGESLSQRGHCMMWPLFPSPTEVYVNLLCSPLSVKEVTRSKKCLNITVLFRVFHARFSLRRTSAGAQHARKFKVYMHICPHSYSYYFINKKIFSRQFCEITFTRMDQFRFS